MMKNLKLGKYKLILCYDSVFSSMYSWIPDSKHAKRDRKLQTFSYPLHSCLHRITNYHNWRIWVEYLILTEESKVIKLFGYIRMVLSKDLLSNLQCPFAEGFCFLVLPTFAIKNSQIVEGCGHLRQSFMLGHLNRTHVILVKNNAPLLYKMLEQKTSTTLKNLVSCGVMVCGRVRSSLHIKRMCHVHLCWFGFTNCNKPLTQCCNRWKINQVKKNMDTFSEL